MENRTLVIGDIHGGLRALKQVLERVAVTEKDQLIFLGDYVDGWSDTPQTINFLIQLNVTHRCVFIRGNHDELCVEWLLKGVENPMWLYHGGQATVDAYQKVPEATRKIHLAFFEKNLQDYFIDSQNRLYVHAGFTNLHGVSKEYFREMFYWDRTLWEMVLALKPDLKKEETIYPKRLLHYKEIFIGHTPVTRIGQTTPVKAANVWNVDTGAAFKGPLTVMEAETKEYWQSDPVFTLYPHEKGRN